MRQIDYFTIGLIVLGGVGLALLLIIWRIRGVKSLERSVKESFGKPPKSLEYDLSSIETYYAYKKASSEIGEYIDDITWDDLDMDKVYRRINVCHTSVGEEYLYSYLREPQFELSNLELRESFISRMSKQPGERFKIQVCLARLGKVSFNGVAELIYNSSERAWKFPFIYEILAIMPFLCAAIIFIYAPIGVVSLAMSLGVNIAVIFTAQKKINASLTAIQYFLSMLKCCGKLLKIESSELQAESLLRELQQPFHIFKPLMRRGIEPQRVTSNNETGVLSEIFKILRLSDIRSYNKIIRVVVNHRKQFHELYRKLGEIDLAICVLSFRESLHFYSTPTFHNENSINFREIYHPLLSAPVSNSGVIGNNSIITGSNASGKSTFIKTLAINSILAQTLFTCTAREYSTRFALIMTSMALRDDISEGESYFITEIKSLKRIIDKIETVYCICFIDEILRGTNTTERIAASAAILDYLSGKDCLCIAASHDIELAQMLDNSVDNYHFREHMTDEGMIFDYKIRQGISNTRNAIKLLRYMEFDNVIVKHAEKLADKQKE